MTKNTAHSNLSKSNKLGWFLSTVVALALIIPSIVMGSYEIYSRYQFEVSVQALENANNSLHVLQEGLSPALWSFVPENAQYFINGVTLNPAIRKITVTDSLGELFVEYAPDEFISLEDDIVISGEVKRDDSVIGEVTLVYSIEPSIQRATSSIYRMLLLIFAQVVFTLIIILFFINRRVTRPLSKLRTVSREIARRNFDIEIPHMFDDEFSDLGDELVVMKHELKTTFDKLEDRVKARTENLTQMNMELNQVIEQLEATKDNLVQNEKLAALGSLVAGVSHELNTPIGNGKLMASALHDTANELRELSDAGNLTKATFDSLTSEILKGTDLINRNLDKSIRLVQSFKQVAVDRTSDSRRDFQLNEFLYEVESTIHHMFKSKPYQLNLVLDKEVTLNSFPGVLSQVISNFINNAIMHGFENRDEGTIILSTKCNSDHVRLTVSDNGVGMPDDVIKRVFEPFFTTKLGKGGSGLGMHIVHNLVTGPLGGKLKIESEVGVGSNFTIIIPLVAPVHASEDKL